MPQHKKQMLVSPEDKPWDKISGFELVELLRKGWRTSKIMGHFQVSLNEVLFKMANKWELDEMKLPYRTKAKVNK